MAKQRMAGEVLNPAFHHENGKMVPSENTLRIMEEGRKYNPDVEVVPYNSVEAVGGVPKWGSGSGHYDFAEDPNKFYVDPIASDTHVVAHELGHAVSSSELNESRGGGRFGSKEQFGNNFDPDKNIQHPANAQPRTGAALRAAHELTGKRNIIEEASAQGFALGVQEKLGIPYTNSAYDDPMDYPVSFLNESEGAYRFNSRVQGDFNESEQAEWNRIQKGAPQAASREFNKAYQRGLNGPQ